MDSRRWQQRLRQSRSKLVNLRAALGEGVSQTQGTWMAVGEEAVVHLELFNPLQTQLQLDHLTLDLTFTPAVLVEEMSAPSSQGSQASVVAGGRVARSGVAWASGTDVDAEEVEDARLVVEKKDLILAAGGRYVVAMRMTALQPGTIRVKGLVWRLGGVVLCRHEVSKERHRQA